MARRPAPIQLLEKTLAEAEAGLARAIATENSTAEANIISRLHTIRTAYATMLAKLPVEAPEPDAAEALEVVMSLLPFLDSDGYRAVTDAVRKGPAPR